MYKFLDQLELLARPHVAGLRGHFEIVDDLRERLSAEKLVDPRLQLGETVCAGLEA